MTQFKAVNATAALNVGPFGRLANTEVLWAFEGISFSVTLQAPGKLDFHTGGRQVMTVAGRQVWKLRKAAGLTLSAFQFPFLFKMR